ncbi:caspase, EACC1-associated type [Actinoalloteichus spitiensis]|uniref:caspase, EACC1-associated type n=1 Tax=Actinoalloteichus spitiensis TaxID=252394 RepID=UPI000361AD8B|nr:AAA domain-containing protein [Actinoalloteichus spitiensis]
MNRRLLRRHALLIHTEVYQDPAFSDLPSTRADTWQLRQVLEHRSVGGFESVRVAADLPADDLRVEIDEFLDERESNELALIYLSGHGVRMVATTGEFYFVATDTKADELAATGISAGFINGCLEDCRAPHKVAVLDCCLSGGFTLGFRTTDSARGTAKSGGSVPLNSRGVYVLSSSGPLEESFSGADTPDGPAPSVFTGAVVEALRTGKAAKDGSGTVSVDDLFDHVTRQLRSRNGQIPTKSSLGVNDRIVIASSPAVGPPVLAPLAPNRPPSRAPGPDPLEADDQTGKRPVSWKELIDYYRACVLEDESGMPYLPVSERDQSYVCLPGAERMISGDLDEDGTTDVPEEAERFLRTLSEHDELWTGYPAVVLHQQRRGKRWTAPHFAPLLVRRVEVVGGEGGAPLRFRPYGQVLPHPGLAEDLLGREEAAHLIGTYQPTWPGGQHNLLATDARNLLRQDFALPCVQELRPESLDKRIDTNSPGDGARNAAVLIRGTEATAASGKLLKDLDYIADHHREINDTALGALLQAGDHAPPAASTVVTPLPTNEAQLAVLRAAMSQRLTVATGPPGTGKSQLVANAVATAVTNGQSVLVASTNNQAVNEVWRRCDRLLRDSVVRTGSSSSEEDYRQHEADALQRLLRWKPSDTTLATARAEHTRSSRQLDRVRADLTRKAEVEKELLDVGARRESEADRLDRTAPSLAEALGPAPEAWERKARRLEKARFFGGWRRSRLLKSAGLETTEDSRRHCRHLADFAGAESRWRRLRAEADTAPSDEDLGTYLKSAEEVVHQSSLALWRVAAAEAVDRGRSALRALIQAPADKSDWRALREVLPHVRAWATTSLSARRFPTGGRPFDLVIIDEASQCSIPQVLPLLFRARRALVIGDVMQLEHITKLVPQREAPIRRRTGVGSPFLEKHKLSYLRHSAFHAAEAAHGGSSLLDEHYRCHPDIAAVSNELFYGGALTVLTDVRSRATTGRPAIAWSNSAGRPQRPRAGTSWINREEAAQVRKCVEYLLAQLPDDATIGVVTPFKAQQSELDRQLGDHDRVRVGTVHTFQGGERDAVVFSLVAGESMSPGAINWVNSQLNLWNVAITRARSHLVLVGDRDFWRQRGGTGGELLRAAEKDPAFGPGDSAQPDPLAQRLYELLSDVPDVSPELGRRQHGHPVDVLLKCSGDPARPVLLDRGCDGGMAPARHLRLMLHRRALVRATEDAPAVRLPAWTVHDSGAALDLLGITGSEPVGEVEQPR